MQKQLLFIACLCFCKALLPQQYPFVYYTAKDGLVNSRVRAIKQDSKGRMYFITYSGLSVYDGTRFVNYDRQNGLALELVNDIIEVGPDSMLIATNTSQLNTLVKGKIGIYKTADGFCPVVNRFLKSNDGHWYVATDDGLYRLDDRKFTRLPFFDNQGKNLGQNLDRIIEWKNFLLVAPWNTFQKEQLILYDRIKQKVVDTYTAEQVVRTGINSKGQLCISTTKSIKELDTLALEQGQLKTMPGWITYAGATERNNVYGLFDNTGNTWVYNNGEVQNISEAQSQSIILSDQGLRTGSLADIFIDREGITWMAFDGNGVVKMTGTNIQYINSLLPGIPSNISAIHQQGDTTWLFNLADYSVYRINKENQQSFPLGITKMSPTDIYTVNQTMYLVDQTRVVAIENKNHAAAYKHPALIFPGIPNYTKIGTGVTDNHGALILHTTTNKPAYLLTVIHNKKVVTEYALSYAVDQITLDPENRLWVVTRDHHLLVFTLHPEQPTNYLRLVKDYTKEIKGINPRSLTVDKTGNVWLGTRYDGVYRLEFNDMVLRSVKQFSTKQGLTDNFVYRMASDNDDNIWAGTQTGLDKIFSRDGRYIVENVTKNKNIFQLIQRIVAGNNGTIWALSNNGAMIKVLAGKPATPRTMSSLLLTSLLINDKEPVDSTKNFSYYENNFSFSVAAPSFIDEKSIRYSYLLKGSGKHTWSEASNSSAFNFINLAPGAYELSVKAEFPGALYPPQFLQYSFEIEPPYWKTWWFRLGLAAFIVGLLVLVVRSYYVRRMEKAKVILEKRQAIEKERTRIATDMHDDLGAGLSRIKFLSETIGIKKQQQLPIEAEIGSIRLYSNEMIDKMGEIVWALNEKNDSLSDLLAYTRAYAVEYLSESGLQISVAAPDEFPAHVVSGEFRRNIYLSVKEALHNIVKHARADHVDIGIAIGKNLNIVISDNGIGIDPENSRPFSNGLINIKKRMMDIGGELKITSMAGTTISLSAPMPK